MEKYKKLLNKKIDVGVGKVILNSYVIIKMIPEHGNMCKCSVDWENKELAGAFPELNFDTKTLDELLETGYSVCPFMSTLYYKIAETVN